MNAKMIKHFLLGVIALCLGTGALADTFTYDNLNRLTAVSYTITPSAFNASLSVTPPTAGVVPINLTSLWAWSNAQSKWYFYAPSLEAQGGTALTDYITSKAYLDFTQNTQKPCVAKWGGTCAVLGNSHYPSLLIRLGFDGAIRSPISSSRSR